MSKSTLNVNNYPAKIYQEGEIQIDIPQKVLKRHLEDCKEGLKDSFPVYLRECDLREMLALIEKEKTAQE